jgi:hypothetical protein
MGGGGIIHETIKELGPYVTGEDPFNTERIWESMKNPLCWQDA